MIVYLELLCILLYCLPGLPQKNLTQGSTFFKTNILHHFKCLLLGFHAFGGNHSIDVLHSDWIRIDCIRFWIWSSRAYRGCLTPKVWKQNYLEYSFNRNLKTPLLLRFRALDWVVGQNRIHTTSSLHAKLIFFRAESAMLPWCLSQCSPWHPKFCPRFFIIENKIHLTTVITLKHLSKFLFFLSIIFFSRL